MLQWLRVDSKRILKLESEVEDLKKEVDYLRNQNKAMLEYIENISKYEKQLINTIEQLTQELSGKLNDAAGEKYVG